MNSSQPRSSSEATIIKPIDTQKDVVNFFEYSEPKPYYAESVSDDADDDVQSSMTTVLLAITVLLKFISTILGNRIFVFALATAYTLPPHGNSNSGQHHRI